MGSDVSPFLTWSDSPVNDDSSTFKSLLWIRMPSAGSKSPYLICNFKQIQLKNDLDTATFACGGGKERRNDLANVTNDDLADKDLAALASPQNGEFVLALDATLQSAELSLLGIIIEGSYQDDDYDGYQNGEALDPFVRLVFLVGQFIYWQTIDKIQKNKQTNGASRLPQNPWNTGRGKRLASMTNAYKAAAFYYNYSERENPTHHRSPRQISRCLLDFSIRHFKNKGVREIQLRVGPRRVIQESLIKPNLMLEKSQRQKLTAPERERKSLNTDNLALSIIPFLPFPTPLRSAPGKPSNNTPNFSPHSFTIWKF